MSDLEALKPVLVKVKLAHQICDKFVQYCKDQLVAGLGYKKFDIHRALEAFLALCSEKVLVGDGALRLAYFHKLSVKGSDKKAAKLGDVYSDFVENLTMFYTSAKELAPIIGNDSVRGFVTDLGKIVDYFGDAEHIIKKAGAHVEPEGVREIFGGEADDGVIDVGGFLGTETASYPVGGLAVQGAEFYLSQLPYYDQAMVEAISAYLQKRQPDYPLPETLTVGTAISLIKAQDIVLFREKLLKKIEETHNLGEWWDTINGLGLNPYARRTLMCSLNDALETIKTTNAKLSVAPTDSDLQVLFSTTNTLGFGVDTLLSPENKATCVNNMVYYIAYICSAQKTYSTTTDTNIREECKKNVEAIYSAHPELRIHTYWDPLTKSVPLEAIVKNTGLFDY